MKKNNKGFTLIELLVVVAIIGILAAVGTVAYTGYTKNAKKSATKSNHAAAVKYVAAELQKCNMDETTAMDGQLTCDDKGDGAVVQLAATTALASFKNPYDTATQAVDKDETGVGYVNITDDGLNVTIVTCFAEIGDGDDKGCVFADGEGYETSSVSNTVSIE